MKKYQAIRNGYHMKGDWIETDDPKQQDFFEANPYWYEEVKLKAK